MVLAPPGCGKTDILSERIVRAHEQGVAFNDMLCLTFTNRASRGMRSRVMERVGESAKEVFVGNVHRFCSKMLYANSLIPSNASIIDEDDVADILLEFDAQLFALKNGQIDKSKVTLIDNIDSYIEQRRHQHPASAIALPETYEQYYAVALQADFDPQQVDACNLWVKYALRYRQYKEAHRYYSFSDILTEAYEALRNDHQRAIQRYSWIQVDEVQDLNALQVAIVDELTDTSKPFTAMYLGDEQQAIFSFMGAKLGQLELLKNRCGSHLMMLGMNYRSPQYLLQIFNTYAQQELGVDPHLLPQSTINPTHSRYDTLIVGNDNIGREADRVAKMVDHYMQFDGERLAIIVPTNRAADRIGRKLEEKGVPYFKISGSDMFESSSYKTLSSFFSVLVNRFNTLAWVRLLYGIGALSSLSRARRFLQKLQQLMLTPSDLLSEEPYLQHFCRVYAETEMVMFDTETTGLNVLEDDIVQIAAFKVCRGERVPGSDFCIFIETQRPIPTLLGDKPNPLVEAYAQHPHHSPEKGLQLFLDYIGQAPLLGHNVMYDYRILQINVARHLHRQIAYETFDSLQLIKCVEPNLHSYKLEALLSRLELQGRNSHLADEDIDATKSLIDYCCAKAREKFEQQAEFLDNAAVKTIAQRLAVLSPLFDDLAQRLYAPATKHTLAHEMATLHNTLVDKNLIQSLNGTNTFEIFLRFVQNEWSEENPNETLYDLLSRHATDMTASINEGDLVDCTELTDTRVFVMTVYKAKGLEFENVVVLESNDGTYPFYTVNNIINNPTAHTAQEVAEAYGARKEDARKFYVALSRAKKRICVSYTRENTYGFTTQRTPFLNSVLPLFSIAD